MRDHFEREEIVHIWSFFVDEIEIYDFVIERAKKCIAAKKGKLYGFLVLYFIYTALLFRFLQKAIAIYGVRTSLFLTSQRMPSRYVAIAIFYKITRKR